ncbi:hypothetical protein Drorol1_Dr00027758 [Drosera rotundifolia]
MAAICLSNLVVSTTTVSSSSKPSRIFPRRTLISPISSLSQSAISLAVPSPSRSLRFWPLHRSRCSARDSASPKSEVEEVNDPVEVKWQEAHADPESPLPTVQSLIIAYKESVLAADEDSVSEIEASLHRIVKEKDELTQKFSVLSNEMTSGKEKYIRLQADFDNFRKRTEKERLSIRSDRQREVIESLLPMVDSFERAKQQIRPETEKETKINASYQGIYKQLVETLRSLRVAAVATVGKLFDPSIHEAIGREESKEFKEGIVIQELRRGFLLDGRLLRPAMVKVSTGLGKKKAAISASEKTKEQPLASVHVVEN